MGGAVALPLSYAHTCLQPVGIYVSGATTTPCPCLICSSPALNAYAFSLAPFSLVNSLRGTKNQCMTPVPMLRSLVLVSLMKGPKQSYRKDSFASRDEKAWPHLAKIANRMNARGNQSDCEMRYSTAPNKIILSAPCFLRCAAHRQWFRRIRGP